MSTPLPMAESLAQLADQMAPVVEMCMGQRKKLEADGWSPTAAETYALELLLGLTRMALSSGQARSG